MHRVAAWLFCLSYLRHPQLRRTAQGEPPRSLPTTT